MLEKTLNTAWMIILIALATVTGCADMGDRIKDVSRDVTDFIGVSKLPDPIATSLDTMPRDAAAVVKAIEHQITGRGDEKIENIIFMQAARMQLAKANLPVKNPGLRRTAAHLYEYKAFPDNPIIRKISGRLLYAKPNGQRASMLYEAQFRPAANAIIIDYAAAEPYFSPSPEIEIFVVEAARLPADRRQFSDTYSELRDYVRMQAMPREKPSSADKVDRDYVMFVFSLDRISATAKLEVKLSDKAEGLNGNAEDAGYFNFDGWPVAYLPATFRMYENLIDPPLYLKAVFTPGRDSGLVRKPKLIGSYHLSGVKKPQ